MRSLVPVLLLWLVSALPVMAQDTPSAGDRGVETVPVNTGEDPPPEETLSTTYSTIGLSMMSADFDNVKEAVNLETTLIGLRVPTFPWVSAELNIAFTMIPGQVDAQDCSGIPPTCPANESSSNEAFVAHTFGVYAVGRSPGKFFGMGKIGYRYLNSSLPEFEDEGNGTSWAAGAGYRWAPDGFVELGYTRVMEKLYAIGLTVSYSHDR